MYSPVAVVDFETASEAPLKGKESVGAWKYAEHPSTHILCLGYRIGYDGVTQLWTPDKSFPTELVSHIKNGGYVEAHNAQFEYAIWYNILYKKMGIPMPTRWLDTLAVCAYRALPLGLKDVGDALGLTQQKDKRGEYLIQKLCKPKKPLKKECLAFLQANPGKSVEDMPVVFNKDPALLQELYDYCIQDVNTEVELSKTIGHLPPDEYQVWVLDQIINKRGVYLDLHTVNSALAIAGEATPTLEKELREITRGAVQKGGEIAKIRDWIKSQGLVLEGLTADIVDDALEGDYIDRNIDDTANTPAVRRVLELRQHLSMTSAKKYVKMRECACSDSRARGLLQYHGAATGRWAGRLIQPQNLIRAMPPYVDEKAGMTPEILIENIKYGRSDVLELTYGSSMGAVAAGLRSAIIAAPGHTLRVADFSAIEARVSAWVAGEQWKVDAFYAIDRGEGYKGAPDIYCATASAILGRPITKADKERSSVGKPCELASGYQGWVAAWRKFDKSDRYNDEEVGVFMGGWRKQHPMIVASWAGLQHNFGLAIDKWKPTSYRGIRFEPVEDAAGKWMTIVLPNGRRLWYFRPETKLVPKRFKEGEEYQSTYWGRDSLRQGLWCKISTYGGKLLENIVQAISRDLMVASMFRVEPMGYPIILSVHDELVAEVPIGHGSQEEFERLMAGPNPLWAPGCPVAVSGWCGPMYKKD